MIAILIPFQSVGDFVLKSNIDNYIKEYSFCIRDYSSDLATPAAHYSVDYPRMALFVENNLIEEVACYEELLYKGRNLIGMKIEEFISHTGENFVGEIDCLDFEDDGLPQYVYEFESIGLQVWVKGRKGNILTIIASSKYKEN
ncbi:hypothetical protein HX004_08385 [Myroides sp. 1354]|uniref:hypothetical protein n=1 Tax=unclassified Myroides TaxID=2642485 RepID=UPI0025759F1A|nr:MULTISPECIES: hypothetical protein [unclassified Myroides]MDM1046612.1 hypothetical protein [Myroides sp. R163-1]MDM1055788.1 hypothetical protein [Myroides sp. 1354]MDM1069969.1 hypothetical protein [Myroides sp. 1372]